MKKKFSNKQYAEALYEITTNLSADQLTGALKQFVTILASNQRLKQAGNIITEFEKYAKKQAGIIEIEVKSARKLDPTTLENIKKVFGKQVEAVETVDKELLGGVAVQTEDKIYLDNSCVCLLFQNNYILCKK